MIQIPHLELNLFPKCRNEIIFFIFCTTKSPGTVEKNKINNQKEQFYFYSSFGKIRVGGFRKSEK